MKQLAHYFCMAVMAFSCSGPANDAEMEASIQNEKITYTPPNFDTVITNKELSMYNEDYDLTIELFSLNDSLVKNPIYIPLVNADGYDTITSITHNNAATIKLKKGVNHIFDKTIYKTTFADSLDQGLMENISLYKVDYTGVRTNRLYFQANIGIPETDIAFEAKFAIFYQTDKLGQLDYWGVQPMEYF